MRWVNTKPNEYLVVGRQGRIRNCGVAANVFLWPGSTWVRIPATAQEARFEMTQETSDGIPLRFKGIVLYRVVDPVAAATLFDFTGRGHEEIKERISHICLGELRATVSHMTMADCIEQRKTALTHAVQSALTEVTAHGWGLELGLVQVAQVFIVDGELRRKLESGVRNEVDSRSRQSDIRLEEEVRLAQLLSERRVEQELLRSEREKAELEKERQQIAYALQAAEVEVAAPVNLLKLERHPEYVEHEITLRRLANESKALEVEGNVMEERVRQELRRRMLPIEQAPAIAEALAKIFQGTTLSVYGADAEALAPLAMLMDLVKTRLPREDVDVSGP